MSGAGLSKIAKQRVAEMRKSINGRWHCKRKECDRAKHIELRTRLMPTGDVVEVFRYECGHSMSRVVGFLIPDVVFDEIERRLASCT